MRWKATFGQFLSSVESRNPLFGLRENRPGVAPEAHRQV